MNATRSSPDEAAGNVEDDVDMDGPQERVYKYKQGRVLIINNNFASHPDVKRIGSQLAVKRLQDTFTSFGMQVTIREDLKHADLEMVIKEFQTTFPTPDELQFPDASIVVMMSHGTSQQRIISEDGKCWNIEDVLDSFNNTFFHSARPKIFIFQVCRGEREDSGALVETGAAGGEDDAWEGAQEWDAVERLPVQTDMLVCHSTVNQYKSRRSWYIPLLCEVFDELADEHHFIDILHEVAERMKRKVGQKDGRKQMCSYINNGFTRKFYLKPNINLWQSDAGPSDAAHHNRVLRQKWWPEKVNLIPSFVQRTTIEGELLADYLKRHLDSSPEDGVAEIVAKKIVLIGMGGIGKSSTAKWYAKLYESEYDHIIWIDSDGSSLNDSITELGKDLRVQTSGRLSKLASSIYAKLTTARCLFVFDNAERLDGLLTLLPTQESHHTIITSKNRDWGNANEFQLPVCELSLFTPEQCIQLLTRTLPTAKLGDEIEMRALSEQLGHLPLALQCAIATILNSTRYNVKSYLQEIRDDLKILVDKRLNSYERTVSATLNLSIQQIEQDDQIDSRLRELCKTILSIAAYCEPDDIAESVFSYLPNATKELVSDALDMLLVYSLVTPGNDRHGYGRCFAIHRLMQHVIRQNLGSNRDFTLRVIRLGLECTQAHGITSRRHSKHVWDLASVQFNEILRECHKFPYAVVIAQIGPFSSDIDFVRRSICNLAKVFKELDLPLLQFKLLLIKLLESKDEISEAKFEYDSLYQQVNNSDHEFKAELMLHLRIIAVEQVMLVAVSLVTPSPSLNAKSEQIRHELIKAIRLAEAESYARVLAEMTATGYTGIVENTQLYYYTRERFDGLNLRMAVFLNYGISLFIGGQCEKAVEALKVEFGASSDQGMSLDLIHGVYSFLHANLADKLLVLVSPDLYRLLKFHRNALTMQAGNSTESKYHAAGVEIIHFYCKYLHQFSRPVADSLDALSFMCRMTWRDHQLDISCRRVLETAYKATVASDMDELSLLRDILLFAWEKLTSLLKAGAKSWPAGSLLRLLELNMAISCVLLRTGQTIRILDLDKETMTLLSSDSVNCGQLPESRSYTKRVLRVSHLVNTQLPNDPSTERVLESKLSLTRTLIKKLTGLTNPDHKWPGLILDLYDDACFMSLFLGQLELAKSLWQESVQLFIGRGLEFEQVMFFGFQTLDLLESRQHWNCLDQFLDDISSLINVTYSCLFVFNHVLKAGIRLIMRLVARAKYSSAISLAQDLERLSIEESNLIPQLSLLENNHTQDNIACVINNLRAFHANLKSDFRANKLLL